MSGFDRSFSLGQCSYFSRVYVSTHLCYIHRRPAGGTVNVFRVCQAFGAACVEVAAVREPTGALPTHHQFDGGPAETADQFVVTQLAVALGRREAHRDVVVDVEEELRAQHYPAACRCARPASVPGCR